MKRYSNVIELRAEKLDEHKRLHANVWPGVLAMINLRIPKIIYLVAALLCISTTTPSGYGRNLDSLQKSFLDLKFGMFIHFNMATYIEGEWSTGREDPLLFNPVALDCGQWAAAAAAAHMKYAVLTVKHTGGWCLWDSAYTDHDVTMLKNYKNGKGDLVQEFCTAFRKRNIKIGFYYCFPLWNKKWADYQTLPIEGYSEGKGDAVAFIKNQFTELLTGYGDVSVLWVDQFGAHNGGLKPGDWESIKAHVHSLQPNCIVIANNSTQFSQTDIYSYEYPYSHKLPPTGNTNPSEVCDKIQEAGWFWKPKGIAVNRSVDYIVNTMLIPLTNRRSNYLLNCAPDTRGLMPDDVVKRLREIGKAWDPIFPAP